MKNVLRFLPVQMVPICYHDEPEDIFYLIASFSCYENFLNKFLDIFYFEDLLSD